MTIKERINIVNYTFDELWDNLWLSKNNQYHSEYDTSKKKFNLLKISTIQLILRIMISQC